MALNKKKLIVILGPTGSGKTKLSVELSRIFNGEVISADSRQIYKGMDIGTNKIRKHQDKGITHHMIDITRPDQDFTVQDFKEKAVAIANKILKKGKMPFLVGGTGLYIKAVVDNLNFPRVAPYKKFRTLMQGKSTEELYERLKKIDPQSARLTGPNKRRIIRALEVHFTTGIKFSDLRQKGEPIFDSLQIGISSAKTALKKKITQRTNEMIKEGLVDEVKRLIRKYDPALPAMSAIGYQEIIRYLNGELSLIEAKKEIIRHTLQYVRRQMQWFRKDKRIHWIKNSDEAKKLIKDFLKK